MRRALPAHLRRRWLAAWIALLGRSLAAAGLLFTAVLAATAHRGLICLAFLSAATIMGVAVAHARRATSRAHAALCLHRTIEAGLEGLAARGWQLKHNVRWPEGPGCGHLAMIPAGNLAFAIKDCTGDAGDFDLAQTQGFATALSEAGAPYVPICVSANAAEPRADRGVVCCAPEQLSTELLDAEKAFGASLGDEALQSQLLYGPAEV